MYLRLHGNVHHLNHSLYLLHQLMRDKDEQHMEIPEEQKMERHESIAREHSEEYHAALKRAVALDIPQAYSPSLYGTFNQIDVGEDSGRSSVLGSSLSHKKRAQNWNEFVGRLFDGKDLTDLT